MRGAGERGRGEGPWRGAGEGLGRGARERCWGEGLEMRLFNTCLMKWQTAVSSWLALISTDCSGHTGLSTLR